MSLAVYKDMRSINASASTCKPRIGSKRAAREAYPTAKLTNPGPAAEARAETEFATQGDTAMGEETLLVDKMLTAAEASERRRYGEFESDELASADESPTDDETISDDQVYEDAASHKSLDDESAIGDEAIRDDQVFQNATSYKSLNDGLYDVDRILGEKQGDSGTSYLVHGAITVKMNLHGSRRKI